MIEVRLFGPRDDQWAVISAKGKWLATTRAIYVVAVKNAIAAAAFKDALAAAIAKQSNPSD
jgi:hypothetical protein